jgi:hypothetical protein
MYGATTTKQLIDISPEISASGLASEANLSA